MRTTELSELYIYIYNTLQIPKHVFNDDESANFGTVFNGKFLC
jgi:hypothetical protein